jgi:predicted PhzF superfamily epimerase YddE/YHI9
MLLNLEGTTLRIFTPSSELPFAGHPTIGTFHTITEADQLFKSGSQEYGIGIEKNDEGFLFLVTQSEPQWTATDLSRVKEHAQTLPHPPPPGRFGPSPGLSPAPPTEKYTCHVYSTFPH